MSSFTLSKAEELATTLRTINLLQTQGKERKKEKKHQCLGTRPYSHPAFWGVVKKGHLKERFLHPGCFHTLPA